MSHRTIVAILGQSNAAGGAQVGDVTIDTSDTGDLSQSFAPVSIVRKLASSSNDPPEAWTDYALGPLAPRNVDRMGVELAVGRLLEPFVAHDLSLAHYAVNGTSLAANWHPDGDYPAAGSGNLYNLAVAWLKEQEAALQGRVTAAIWIQGNGDADDSARAAAYGANLALLLERLRHDLNNPGMWFAFDRYPEAFRGDYKPTLHAGQEAFAASKDRVLMIDTDDLVARDDPPQHYTADSFVVLGRRFAAALGPALRRTPAYVRQAILRHRRERGSARRMPGQRRR